ncbi:polyphosphate polymerase domain-containing protein [Butyrivibrio sp. AE2032]|uniref:polyphosphate polymerase domain-containing protein n=1 Tax=Butyrivibrio sp. AE2032 TaxID=1458463 RepID=UPI000553DE8F|nr:polyphosphate polymerase domain-containing protein [Butyrivibrio sp. AE2032]
MKKYRNEWKYQCHEKTLFSVMERLKGVLPCDEHGDNGSYVIRSLYFDDDRGSFARDTETGITKRYKYRIRYYGHDTSTLKLEKKEKLHGRCHKESCHLSLENFEKIVNGDYIEVFWSTENKVLQEFCARAMTMRLSPKIIVEYDRTAIIEPIANIRITADRNISYSPEIDRFLQGDYLRVPIMSAGQHILEVKFDHVLPGYIKRMTSDESLVQSSFSKYYMARKNMSNTGRRI